MYKIDRRGGGQKSYTRNIPVEVKNYFKAISRERTVFGPLPPPAHSILYIYVMDPICNT